MASKYKALLCTKRFRQSTVKREQPIDEFGSDRSRLLYSSSFRRLQQKAQVFSLESNSSVRTRMTHTLEVSDIGRILAKEIADRLCRIGELSFEDVPAVVSIVENACLLHDIGNPPFGHFGEAAIKQWAEEALKTIEVPNKKLFNILANDFYEFDGNPQGLRIITRLHTEADEYSLNLTYATLLCTLKYVRAPGQKASSAITKKAGYFLTEEELVNKMWTETGMKANTRYPFVYIMEAADDIAYCMSDISDGIEKGIITAQDFVAEFEKLWKLQGLGPCPLDGTKINSFSRDVSIPWTKKAIAAATANFINNKDEFFAGRCESLIPKGEIGSFLSTVKKVSRNILYSSIQAESIELTGYAVITGILNQFRKLLMLQEDDFRQMMNGSLDGYEFEKRLFHRIGKRYIAAYNHGIERIKSHDSSTYRAEEMWLRIHLIIDHVSGMTDEYALQIYQMLSGISLLHV